MSGLAYRQRRLAGVFASAAALAGALIAASALGAAPDRRATTPTTARTTASQFAGIRQHGAVLGNPKAPVTLVEYADLQCPYCAEWARLTLPVLVASYVRPGKLRIAFNGLAFLGPDSRVALRTAIAAGRHDRLWDVVDALYLSQGPENSGWVDDALLARIAGDAGLDWPRLRSERAAPWVARTEQKAAAAATAAGISSTPSFQLGRTGGALQTVTLHSLGPDGLVPALDSLLAR